jgi:hypothetical protein
MEVEGGVGAEERVLDWERFSTYVQIVEGISPSSLPRCLTTVRARAYLVIPSARHKDRLPLILDHLHTRFLRISPALPDPLVDLPHVRDQLTPRLVWEAAEKMAVRGREEPPELATGDVRGP